MPDDGSMEWFCGGCGAIFDPFDSPDFDDVRCPECFSQDVGAVEDLDGEAERSEGQGGF